MKTAAFIRKQEDLWYDDVGPLTTLLVRVLGVAPGLGYACLKHRRALISTLITLCWYFLFYGYTINRLCPISLFVYLSKQVEILAAIRAVFK